jgi:hypothetical protein
VSVSVSVSDECEYPESVTGTLQHRPKSDQRAAQARPKNAPITSQERPENTTIMPQERRTTSLAVTLKHKAVVKIDFAKGK